MRGEKKAPQPFKFNIVQYCPALIALWEKHIANEQGFLLPPEQIQDFELTVEVELSSGESSAFHRL
ncbi:hypothetical protein A2767_07130 [Candidatus Roizmanbacteria bacterium RIFCSPHIGHO2_01_FULL_35_10]|uniref:Uncharacterized protein n=1 Tax=Candidatus Roizmanbacteria bacterium RIFCSPLOWO2_01_FULL_35_13 TaxID=1802055 RepID=A0A1F7IDA4_9BACT|nr:MAG: hypothetical protein A2767_07130 [Candidatus Roizmanbacteria bacterium RIFCSPHIGHO2_01_FULL_35_10]OGK41328.1 MAG: hypothetical protein A3A74_03270 [Candidatus Roizmanbacteria bacterium RIFCSPLOWO2_01_FULL_35_13]